MDKEKLFKQILECEGGGAVSSGAGVTSGSFSGFTPENPRLVQLGLKKTPTEMVTENMNNHGHSRPKGRFWESTEQKKSYLSNCVNSFEVDSGVWNNKIRPIVFRDATEFQQEWDDQNKIIEITQSEFYNNVDEATIPKKALIQGPNISYWKTTDDFCYIIYNENSKHDIHYFFV